MLLTVAPASRRKSLLRKQSLRNIWLSASAKLRGIQISPTRCRGWWRMTISTRTEFVVCVSGSTLLLRWQQDE